MSTQEITATEMFNSLTGFDDIAVAKQFGHKSWALAANAEADPMTFALSLIFVAKRRDGLSDQDAYNAALSLTFAEASTYFAEEVDEPMPDEPSTPAGKGS